MRFNIGFTCLAAGLIPAACAPRMAPTPPSAPQHEHASSELPASPGRGYTVADVRFMQNMIGHHAQAITMAALAPGRTLSDPLLRLAQKIDISQKDEMAMMKQWLRERNQSVPADEAPAHTMMMPGMLNAAQLAELAAARGSDFDRLFLTSMIRHHEGALYMVDELYKTPGAAQDSDLFRFVTDVDADQRDEILGMQNLLATLR